MKLSIECSKCGGIHTITFTTFKKHIVKAVCPFCRHEEAVEVGR